MKRSEMIKLIMEQSNEALCKPLDEIEAECLLYAIEDAGMLPPKGLIGEYDVEICGKTFTLPNVSNGWEPEDGK